MGVWSVPKLGTELLKFFGLFGAVPGLITDCYWSMCYNLCNKLWFGCCCSGNGHGFWFHKVEPMLGERLAQE